MIERGMIDQGMIEQVEDDEALRREAATFELRYTCEDCVYFLPDAPPGNSCAHGYPNLAHLRARADAKREPIVFCKEYELR